MFNYALKEWIFFFYFYCFIGWCFESTYVSIRTKRLVNRGFMRGPFLPLYGSGAIMMLLVSIPFRENLFLVYIAGCIGATILELITGLTMEALFKTRYWDYSRQRIQFRGHICLSSSLFWGVLTICLTQFLHPYAERVLAVIPSQLLTGVLSVICVITVADFTLSFKAAMDIRFILEGLDKAKEELVHLQKRLDVLIAVTNDEWESKKLSSDMRMEEMIDNIEGKFIELKEKIKINPSAFVEDVKEELAEMRSKYIVQKERRFQLKNIKDFYKKGILRDNPTMYSKRFQEALEELKKMVSTKDDQEEK